MRKATLLTPVLLAVAVAFGVTCWWLYRAEQTVELVLYFHPFVGPEPLVLNESRYPNPGGAGRFRVRDFQMLLSNIRLLGASGSYVESESYHLVRFDGEDPAFAILLRDVPCRDYERIEFGIGVDATANRSITPRGDLDPNGRMAWTWEVGYKFVLLEGELSSENTSCPLVYHIGFDENYRTISTDLRGDLLDSSPARLDFRVDILRLFQSATTVDMAALSTVKFDPADAALLGRNFADMVTPMPQSAAGPSDGAR
jgi:hypothetical protein